MAQTEVTIDSVRRALLRQEWSVILKQRGAERYLPIYMGPSQANIVKGQIIGPRFPEPEVYERFLAGADIAKAALESVTVEGPKKNLFRAKLLLTERGESLEGPYQVWRYIWQVKCMCCTFEIHDDIDNPSTYGLPIEDYWKSTQIR